MDVVFKYDGGVLSFRDELYRYFEIDLGGRVRVYKGWVFGELRSVYEEAGKFLVDFLRRRKVKNVDYDRSLWDFKFHSYTSYNVVLVYDDCEVYLNFEGGRYNEVLLLHENFSMAFSRHDFLFKLLRGCERCEIIESRCITEGYLERLVLEFSKGMFDINVECEFEYRNRVLSINVNGKKLFEVGFDGVECLNREFIYYLPDSVGNKNALYEFMWELYDWSLDRSEFRREGSYYVFETDNFVVRCNEKAVAEEILYRYRGAGIRFEIKLDFWIGYADIRARVGVVSSFRSVFYIDASLFKKLIRDDGRLKRYIEIIGY